MHMPASRTTTPCPHFFMPMLMRAPSASVHALGHVKVPIYQLQDDALLVQIDARLQEGIQDAKDLPSRTLYDLVILLKVLWHLGVIPQLLLYQGIALDKVEDLIVKLLQLHNQCLLDIACPRQRYLIQPVPDILLIDDIRR